MRIWVLLLITLAAFGCVSSPPAGFKGAGEQCTTSGQCAPGAWCEGYAESDTGTVTPGVCTQFFDWRPYAVIGVVLSLTFTSLAFMLSALLNMPSLSAWAKGEFVQAIASALFIGMLIAFVASMNVMLNTIAGEQCDSQQECHMELARKYLDRTIDGVKMSAKGILGYNSILMALSSISITFEMNQKPYSQVAILPLAPLSMINDTLATAFDILMKVMIVLYFQKFTLIYIQQAIFPLFLTLGIVLRTFFFTRRLGGLLIAIGIGIYVILPLMYVLAFVIAYPTNATNHGIAINYAAVDENSVLGYYERYVRPQALSVVPFYKVDFPPILDLNSFTDGAFISWLIGNDGVLERVARLLVLATFIPYFALITTISFIKIFSPFIGGDVEIAGLTHLI